jgi:hypothetical protein
MAMAWTSAEVREDKISPTYDVDVDGDKIAEMHFLALDFKQVFFRKVFFQLWKSINTTL